MPPFELSPCINLLYADAPRVPFPERIARAAADGNTRVDMWEWSNRDLAALGAALEEHGVTLSLLSAEPELDLTDSTTHEEFLAGLHDSAAAAAQLHCRNIVVSAGDALPGVERDAQRDAVVAALRRGVAIAEEHDLTILLENLNAVDHEGCFLDSAAEALAIVRAVSSERVRLLYDLYHSVMMGEEPGVVLAGSMDLVGYVQVADVPGRHEPGSGSIDWPAQLAWLLRAGYDGPLGLEYEPTGSTTDSLRHIRSVVGAVVAASGCHT